MARELDRAPDLLVTRLGDDPVELALQPLELTREARAAQERQAPEPAQLAPQSQLGLTSHRRRAAAAGRPSLAARAGRRSRPRDRTCSWTRRGRSPRAASPGSSAARPADR